MIVLSDLQKQLLASIEAHGKCNLKGFYELHPQSDQSEIDGALDELKEMGWVKVRKTQVIDGQIKKIPWVGRTKKQLYSQLELL